MFVRAARLPTSSVLVSAARGKATGIKIQNVSADFLPYKGQPAANRPTKVQLDAGKTYFWCSCGLSVKQPFCDGSHKLNGVTNARPVQFTPEKSGEFRMCNCKQTDSRPICDGSHKKTDPAPKDYDATRMVAFGSSPVYDGVAHKLGYKPKNEGFQ